MYIIHQSIAQQIFQYHSENAARYNVITIAEPAGNAKNLIIGQEGGRFENALDVNELGLAAGCLKCQRGFAVAVCSGSTKDYDARLRHRVGASWPTSPAAFSRHE